MNSLKYEIITLLKGARNGLYYGGKVRFLHSIVIISLFGKGSINARIKSVISNTFQHASSLGLFVFLYKLGLLILKKLFKSQKKWHYLIAGGLMGLYVFGRGRPIDQQIVLYILSRIIVGGIKFAQNNNITKDFNYFPLIGMLSWGIVMYLFEKDASSLQPSLSSSMRFLYHDSDQFNGWTDLIPIYVPTNVKNSIDKLITRFKRNSI